MNAYQIINILDMADAIGEDEVQAVLSDFSCPLNHEVEHFIQDNALQFAKEKKAITYLLVDNQTAEINAFFTLTHKAIEINGGSISNSIKRKLKAVSSYERESDTYLASAFLIAQFGKNDKIAQNIDGIELMRSTLIKLQDIQREIGGSVVYLECEKKQKLIDFYSSEENHFYAFNERHSEDGVDYLMMMRILKSKK
jgi:hypothetical protein